MKLSFANNHLSIKKFNSVEVPPLTVLTGLNGSGKSHLLEAMVNGAVSCDIATIQEIVHFNAATFYLDAETDFSPASIVSDRASLLQQFEEKKDQELEMRKAFLPNDHFRQVTVVAKLVGKHLYELSDLDFRQNQVEGIFNGYRKYRARIEGIVKQLTPPNLYWNSVWSFVHRANKPLSEITKEDIDEFYSPINQKNNFLITQIGKAFIDYYDKWEHNRYNSFCNERYKTNHPILDDESFKKKYGEPPWEMVNRLLKNFSSLDYQVNYPENLERTVVFKLKLISRTDPNIEIGFENLSSGEKTMLALVSCMYKSQIDTEFPKLLLLDEIDSSLHPSMTKNLFDVVNDIFVKEKGMHVVLVTHSPSTVAMTPPESVFVMKRSGENRIIKTTNEEALNILTEGFASLSIKESSLRLSYVLSKTSLPVVLTEGITDRIILEKAWETLYGNDPPFEVQDCFDASFLKNMLKRGELFRNYPSRKFIAVFDFDEEGYQSWGDLNEDSYDIIELDPKKALTKKNKLSHGFALLLPSPDNDISKQVMKSTTETFKNRSHLTIELLFWGESSLTNSFIEESHAGGGKLIKFTGNKVTFAENKVQSLPKDAFKHFIPLFDKIKSIINSQ